MKATTLLKASIEYVPDQLCEHREGDMTPEECLEIYGRAWFESEPDRRIELLSGCCTDDVLFVDPLLGRLVGVKAVSDMIEQYMALMRGGPESSRPPDGSLATRKHVSVEKLTEIERLHGFFRYSFAWRLSSGQRMGGSDFGEFAEDGRMRLIVVFPETDDFPIPMPHNKAVQPTRSAGV